MDQGFSNPNIQYHFLRFRFLPQITLNSFPSFFLLPSYKILSKGKNHTNLLIFTQNPTFSLSSSPERFFCTMCSSKTKYGLIPHFPLKALFGLHNKPSFLIFGIFLTDWFSFHFHLSFISHSHLSYHLTLRYSFYKFRNLPFFTWVYFRVQSIYHFSI